MPAFSTLLRHTALVVLFFATLGSAPPVTAGELQLVSHTEFSQLSAKLGFDGPAESVTTSADGRYVGFESIFPLVGSDTNGSRDIYLWDRDTGEIQLVSHAFGAPLSAADGESLGSTVSADGSTVVFLSDAGNGVPGDRNGERDVFIWDRATGQITLVSRAEGGGTANGASQGAFISGDGSKVVFSSLATNLSLGLTDSNSQDDVFIWDRAGDVITLVSHAAGDAQVAGDASSLAAGLSEAGDEVLLESQASDLVGAFVDQNGGNRDLYLWRAEGGSSELVTQSGGITLGGFSGSNGVIFESHLSADGSSVTYAHSGTDLIPGFVDEGGGSNIFQWSEATRITRLVSHGGENVLAGGNGGSRNLSTSADGAFVAFETSAGNLSELDSNGRIDIYRWRRSDGSLGLISVEHLFPFAANEDSESSAMSRDGSALAFRSRATNLVDGFNSPSTFPNHHAYVWQEGSPIQLVSRSIAAPTTAADGHIDSVTISGDGSMVYFASNTAIGLVAGIQAGLFRFDLNTERVSAVSTASRLDGLTIGYSGRANRAPAISDDGRFVAYATTAQELVDGFVKSPGVLEDVFYWDRVTGRTLLLSRSINGPTLGGNDHSLDPMISGDGSVVAFLSDATDLIPGYVQPTGVSFNPRQLYVWEKVSDEITLISRAADSPTTGVDTTVREPVTISADGNSVVFSSRSSNLISGVTDTNGSTDLFLWDRTSDTTHLISESIVPGQTGNGFSRGSSISDEGAFIAFRSGATDLVAGLKDTNGRNDVFVWERSTGETTLVNHVIGDPLIPSVRGSDSEFSLSGDGSTVAFVSSGSDIVTGADSNGNFNIFAWDRVTNTNRWVTKSLITPGVGGDGDSNRPKLSFGGSALTFESRRQDLVLATYPPFRDQLFYWHRDTDQVSLITRSATVAGAAANASARRAALSADGQKIVFESRASDLVDGTDLNSSGDIFQWERGTGVVSLLSHSLSDPSRAGNKGCEFPNLSRDGSTPVFIGRSTDHVDGDVPVERHVFISRESSRAELRSHLQGSAFPVPTGAIYSYQLSVENLSANDASHVMAVLTLPVGEAFIDATGRDWSCKRFNISLACRRAGALPAGELSSLLTVRLRAPDIAGTSAIEGIALWPGSDGDLSDNRASFETTFAPDDWGDAPDSYSTLAASNGASHGFSGLILGAAVNVDVDGQPSADADGDTTDGTPDEDGVSFISPIVIGESGNVEVIASEAGVLDAWIDWNASGDWQNPDEKTLDGVAVVAGVNTVPLTVPLGSQLSATFARFRLSSAGTAAPTGRAADGEVEDYVVQVEAIGLTAAVSAAPTTAPELGGDVTFTVRITNIGSQNATLMTLVDDHFGSVTGQGSCAVPQTIASGAFYECAYSLNLSGPVDATEIHSVTGVADSLGFALMAADSAEVTFFDSIAPGLASYAASPSVGDELVDCATLRASANALTITFSEQLAIGTAGADDATSYRLLGTGPDLSFETAGCGTIAASDVAVPFMPAYQPGADRFDPSTTTLGTSLADGLYRLIVCDGLEDLGANPLPGGDISIGFRVDAGNLFRNGHFDCEIADWQQDPASPEIVYDPLDAEGSVESGSLLVSSTKGGGSGGSSFGLGQCLAIAEQTDVEFRVDLRLDIAADDAIGMARSCVFYSDALCQSEITESVSIDLLSDTSGAFSPRVFDFTSPGGSQSMDCRFDIEAIGGAFELYLDRAVVKIESSIFADGFESGDTSAWTEALQ